jgi:maltose alpha-D-glucosyltransferase/alpha-amylase
MLDLWYKNAVVYNLDVETFVDGNGDGVGDFVGLADRLDHLEALGATCVWLLPFYPSPNRDNGYDVTDYYGVDPRLGTLGDFVAFAHAARDRGMRIIADLVVNHSSIDHPWFQAALKDPSSPYRDYYVWSEEKPAKLDQGVVFPGYQETTWTWSEEARAWYFHRFYEHQADLNIENPAVREEIQKIMGFWLQLGVSGFRIDAAPFLIETVDPQGGKEERHFEYITEMRDFLSWRRGDAVLLAEANVPAEEIPDYFGENSRMHMMFNFLANQATFLALRRRDATPLVEQMRRLPATSSQSQWATFLRNHDELDLGRLSPEDRREVFAEFAPDPGMQLYDRGIRRRLAPMLGNDRDRLAMAYSLNLSLPGTPVLRYGEEIGMGDDLSLPERMSIRTPMQWDDGPAGGFSTAPADRLVRPVIRGGEFGTERLNVQAQRRDPHSLMCRVQALIHMRRRCPEIGWGSWEVLRTGVPAVLAHACRWRGGTVFFLHNFGEDEVAVEPDPMALGLAPGGAGGSAEGGRAQELIADRPYPAPEGGRFKLGRYGYRWFRVGERV